MADSLRSQSLTRPAPGVMAAAGLDIGGVAVPRRLVEVTDLSSAREKSELEASRVKEKTIRCATKSLVVAIWFGRKPDLKTRKSEMPWGQIGPRQGRNGVIEG